jgi:2-hydroxy-6-oxonona-2,4-dienedioate hydrolase
VTAPSIWLSLADTEYHHRFYDAGGVRTRVLEAGEGELLLLLHGTGGHLETYHRNVAALAKHFRVAAIDMLGHGFTARPDGIDYNLDDYADHILALADAMGARRLAVSGESLGAMVAAWTALRAPDRVTKVVLNTGTLVRPGPEGLEQLADLEGRTADLAAELTREKVRRRLEWLVLDPASMTDEIVDCRLRIYAQPGMLGSVQKIMGTVLSMIRGTYPRDYFQPRVLSGIRCPAMVLWTEHNPGQGLREAEATIKQLPGAEYHVLRNCAHWPQFENPEEFNKLHIDFLTA